MGGLPRAQEGGPGGAVELEDVGQLLDCFPAVLEALSVHPEMKALVLGTAAGERFETCHNRLGGGHILATVAHNLDIVGLQWWLVVNCCVSC